MKVYDEFIEKNGLKRKNWTHYVSKSGTYQTMLEQLRHFKTHPYYGIQLAVNGKNLCVKAGLKPEYSKEFNKRRKNPNLSRFATMPEKVMKICYALQSGDIIYYDKSPVVTVTQKFFVAPLIEEDEWQIGTRCKDCQNHEYIPLIIDNKPHAACYTCIPPSNYAMIRASKYPKSWIGQILPYSMVEKRLRQKGLYP